MDHAIEQLMPFYEASLSEFLQEQRKHNYKKFSDNPFFEEISALIKSINILNKYCGWESIRLRDAVEFYMDEN